MVVDRIEGSFAVVLIGEARVDVPLAILPEGIREGDSLQFTRAPAVAELPTEPAPTRTGRRARSIDL